MFFQQAPPDAFIVTIAEHPTRETTLKDVLLSALGVTGALVLLALVLGGLLALVLMRWNRRHPPEDDRLPPVSPWVQSPRGSPPSS